MRSLVSTLPVSFYSCFNHLFRNHSQMSATKYEQLDSNSDEGSIPPEDLSILISSLKTSQRRQSRLLIFQWVILALIFITSLGLFFAAGGLFHNLCNRPDSSPARECRVPGEIYCELSYTISQLLDVDQQKHRLKTLCDITIPPSPVVSPLISPNTRVLRATRTTRHGRTCMLVSLTR